jgi:hypothetical protein
MIGGILKYGISNPITTTIITSSSSSSLPSSSLSSSSSPSFVDNSFHFICVDDEGYLLLSKMRLIFLGRMKSMIYIRGGVVCMEYIKINNEEWGEPLIEAYEMDWRIRIEIYMNIIKKCNYGFLRVKKESSSLKYKSAILFINEMSTKNVNINISNCIIKKDIINIFYDDKGNGNLYHFSNRNETSSIIIHYYSIIYYYYYYY